MASTRIVGIVVAALGLLLGCASAALGQTSVSLRGGAKVQAGAPVRVGDVAEIQGADADVLGAVVVMTGAEVAKATGAARVDLAMVRAAVEKDGKVSLGRLAFAGSACVVR